MILVLADTGAGTALALLAGRTLLQTTGDIPNYAASASTPAAGIGGSPLSNDYILDLMQAQIAFERFWLLNIPSALQLGF